MTVSQFIQTLRHLVLEHPYAAELPIVLAPHGHAHRQKLAEVHLSAHETAIVLEAER